MEWLYYLIVCAISVCLFLLIIDFNYRKNRKWIIPIIAITIVGYLFTWQFRPLKFDEIVDISNNTPVSYKVLLTKYNNGLYSDCSIDSESLESDQVRKEIWQNIRFYFFTTEYRQDLHSLLPWNMDKLHLNDNSAGDTISILVVSSDGKNKYQITIMFEGAYVMVLDENMSKHCIYHYLDNEVIHKMDDYIQKICGLPS